MDPRPSDGGGADSEIRGARPEKNFFLALGPQFGPKIRGGLPGPLPWIHHWYFVKELQKRFHLKGKTIGFCPQILKLVKSDK